MAQGARAARAQIPKRGLGLGRAIRRIRELHGIGQEVLAEPSGPWLGYLAPIESGSRPTVPEEPFPGIGTGSSLKPWRILAQAAGFKPAPVERFTEDARVW